MKKTATLDDEQKARLDGHIATWIGQGQGRVQAMVSPLKEMCDGIRFPTTLDPTRAIDNALKRLKAAGKIERKSGHYGWTLKTRKARGRSK